MFLSALLTIVKKRKPPKCSPADERIRSRERKRERECVCVCVFSHTKKGILPFVTLMVLEGIVLSDINETEKDKYCMV